MLYQTDKDLLPVINHYGCAAMSLAYFREKYQGEPWTAQAINSIWNIAVENKIITGDLNGDGDFDEGGEAEIQDWQKLANLMGCHLRYIPGHFPIDSPLAKGAFSICAWYNPNTKFTHFVVGTSKPVEYDPIRGGSKTVRDGYPKIKDGLRIFQILV